jgi:hypothetical protein
MLFHQHKFQESSHDKEMIFCFCGKVKDIHRHKWELYTTITNTIYGIEGKMCKCSSCGELKTFRI